MGKIIHLKNRTMLGSLSLSPLMVKTLRMACQKQLNDEPIGQIDLDGSFNALLKRDFIDAKTIMFNGKKIVCWYVTQAGINSLARLGFKEKC